MKRFRIMQRAAAAAALALALMPGMALGEPGPGRPSSAGALAGAWAWLAGWWEKAGWEVERNGLRSPAGPGLAAAPRAGGTSAPAATKEGPEYDPDGTPSQGPSSGLGAQAGAGLEGDPDA